MDLVKVKSFRLLNLPFHIIIPLMSPVSMIQTHTDILVPKFVRVEEEREQRNQAIEIRTLALVKIYLNFWSDYYSDGRTPNTAGGRPGAAVRSNGQLQLNIVLQHWHWQPKTHMINTQQNFSVCLLKRLPLAVSPEIGYYVSLGFLLCLLLWLSLLKVTLPRFVWPHDLGCMHVAPSSNLPKKKSNLIVKSKIHKIPNVHWVSLKFSRLLSKSST